MIFYQSAPEFLEIVIENFPKVVHLSELQKHLTEQLPKVRLNQCKKWLRGLQYSFLGFRLLEPTEKNSKLLLMLHSSDQIKNFPSDTNILSFRKVSFI